MKDFVRRAKNRLRGVSGFTMAELMIVVALIVALAVIGVYNIINMQRNMEQTRLDRIAENLYSAAQNQLTLRKASVNDEVGYKLKEAGAAKASGVSDELRYLSSSSNPALVDLLIEKGSISDDIREGNWIVEFDPASYTVYSVFYASPDKATVPGSLDAIYEGETDLSLDKLRGTAEDRKKETNATVGYYEGALGTSLAERKVSDLKCMLSISNEMTLGAKLTVDKTSDDLTIPDVAGQHLQVEMTYTGVTSGVTVKIAASQPMDGSWPIVFDEDNSPNICLLDSPVAANSFANKFSGSGLIPGEDITVKATVWCESDTLLLNPATATSSANSLFANGSGKGHRLNVGDDGAAESGDEAYIAYLTTGRHLQNLSALTSPASFLSAGRSDIEARQIKDITFDPDDVTGLDVLGGWAEATYGKFTPVSNPYLVSYYGNGKQINALKIGGVDNAGLFAKFYGDTLDSVVLRHCGGIEGRSAAGAIAAEASGNLTLKNCKVDMTAGAGVKATNGPAGGFIGKVDGGSLTVVNNKKDYAAEKFTVSGAGNAGGVIGDASAVSEAHFTRVRLNLVDVTDSVGAAGGLAGIVGGANDTFVNCEVKESTVIGETAAGGLAGKAGIVLNATGCSLYFEHPDSYAGFKTQKLNGDYMTARSGPAGGLFGTASAAIIKESFAATVVKGSNFAGGLVGSITGSNLKVEKSYADCYIGARDYIGGFVGNCGACEIVSCYSAGFVLNSTRITKDHTVAAGFAASATNGSVKNSYTIFSFKDATPADGKPANIPNLTQKYIFMNVGNAENAYYVDADGANLEGATHLSGALLKDKTIAGFKNGRVNTTLYKLTDYDPLDPYEYPSPDFEGVAHYNDYYTPEEQDFDCYRVVLKNKSGENGVDLSDPNKLSASKKDGNTTTVSYTSYVDAFNEVFVGWTDEEGYKKLQSAAQTSLVSLCEKVDGGIRTAAYDSARGRFVYATSEECFLYPTVNPAERVLTYTINSENLMTIDVTNVSMVTADGENPKLYAVYREVPKFTVNLYYILFDDSKFATSHDANGVASAMDFTVKREKYAGSVVKWQHMEVNPLVPDDEQSTTFVKISDFVKASNYTIIDKNYISTSYPAVTGTENFHTAAGFLPGEDIPNPAEDPYDAEKDSLTIKTDTLREYYLLIGADQLEVPVKLVFKDCQVADGTKTEFGFDKTLEENFAAIQAIINDDSTKYAAGTDYTATIWIQFSPNMIATAKLPTFDGFELDAEHIQNLRIDPAYATNDEANHKWIYDASKAPVIPYKRVVYTLAFDLGSGMRSKYKTNDAGQILAEDGSPYTAGKKPWTTSVPVIDSVTNMHHGESVRMYLPVSEPAAQLALKAGANFETDPVKQALAYGFATREEHHVLYVLSGWKFYKLDDYGPDSEPIDGKEYTLNGDDSQTTYGMLSPDFTMPNYSVIAVALWEPVAQVKIRAEIYVQNVTDNYRVNETVNHLDKDPTFAFYTAYEITTLQTLSDYTGLSPEALLKKVYTNRSDKSKPSLPKNDREYLRDPADLNNDSKVNGTILNPQFYVDTTRSLKGEEAGKEYDFLSDGTAVFRVYYLRHTEEFRFEMNNSSSGNNYTRAAKSSNDPGGDRYPDGYVMYPATWVSSTTQEARAVKSSNDPGGAGYPNDFTMYQVSWENGGTMNERALKAGNADPNPNDVESYPNGFQMYKLSWQESHETYARATKQHYEPDTTTDYPTGYPTNHTYELYELTWSNTQRCYVLNYEGRQRDVWIIKDNLIDRYFNGRNYNSSDDTKSTSSNVDGITQIGSKYYVFGYVVQYGKENNYYVSICPFYDKADVTAAKNAGYDWENGTTRKGLYKKFTIPAGYSISYENDTYELWIIKDNLINSYVAGTTYNSDDDIRANDSGNDGIIRNGSNYYVFGRVVATGDYNGRPGIFASIVPFYNKAEVNASTADTESGGYAWSFNGTGGLFKEVTRPDSYKYGRRSVYILKEGKINDLLNGQAIYRTDFELAATRNGRAIIPANQITPNNGGIYIFAIHLDELDDGTNCYFAPFYTEAEVNAARSDGYRWLNNANKGLYKQIGVPAHWTINYDNSVRELWVLRDELIDSAVGGTQYTKAETELATNSDSNNNVICTVGSTHYILGRVFEWGVDGTAYAAVVPFYDKAEETDARKNNEYSWIYESDYKGLYKKVKAGIRVIKGLYEQPLELAWRYNKTDPTLSDTWTWPEGPNHTKYLWNVYLTSNTNTAIDGGHSLTFLSSFYYFRWIQTTSYNSEHSLTFKHEASGSGVTISFFLQSDYKTDATLNTASFTDPAAYSLRTNSTSFTPNDKFDGYTLYGYRTASSRGTGITRHPQNADGSYNTISNFGNTLNFYYRRNSYQLIFEDVTGVTDATYLYGQSVTGLPDVTTANRPAGFIGDFKGWYTGSGGTGEKLEVRDGKVYAINPADSTERELTMPSANLTIFACWKADDVKIEFYSRLPGMSGETSLLTPEEARQGLTVPTMTATLYEKIPEADFNDMYTRWANANGYAYDPDTRTLTHGANKYSFVGWYRTKDNGVPGHDEQLSSRFSENERVTTAGTFRLAAQWVVSSGMDYYDVLCHLTDDKGNLVKDVLLEKYGRAEVGKPLPVAAPSPSDYKELEGYYPNTSIATLDIFQPPDKKTVEFWYSQMATWDYVRQYQLNLTDVGDKSKTAEIIFKTETLSTSSENVWVMANENTPGYILSPATQPQVELKRNDANKTVTFRYVIDTSSIKLDRNASWKYGSAEVPVVLHVTNFTGNAITSLTAGYEVRVGYYINNQSQRYASLAELLTTAGKEGTPLLPNAYQVKVCYELWKTSGTIAPELTFWSGLTSIRVTE